MLVCVCVGLFLLMSFRRFVTVFNFSWLTQRLGFKQTGWKTIRQLGACGVRESSARRTTRASERSSESYRSHFGQVPPEKRSLYCTLSNYIYKYLQWPRWNFIVFPCPWIETSKWNRQFVGGALKMVLATHIWSERSFKLVKLATTLRRKFRWMTDAIHSTLN